MKPPNAAVFFSAVCVRAHIHGAFVYPRRRMMMMMMMMMTVMMMMLMMLMVMMVG